jgi:hypothetical protein
VEAGKTGPKGELKTVDVSPATFGDREMVVSGRTVALVEGAEPWAGLVVDGLLSSPADEEGDGVVR